MALTLPEIKARIAELHPKEQALSFNLASGPPFDTETLFQWSAVFGEVQALRRLAATLEGREFAKAEGK